MQKEEIKQKYINNLQEYFNKLDPYDYEEIIWDDIKSNYSLANEKMASIDLSVYNDDLSEYDFKKIETEFKIILEDYITLVRKEKSLKSDLLTSREIFIRNVKNISEKVTGAVSMVWDKIKFLFAIPGITFASFIFTFFFTLIFSTVLVWIFPFAYTEEYDGVVEAIICAIIFVFIRFSIFKDVYMNRPEIDIKTYLIKHFIASFIWWTILYLIKYKEIANIFSLSFFEKSLFEPYLVISAFTKEYFLSAILNYAIINALPFVLIILYINAMEKFFSKREKKNKALNDEEMIEDTYYDNKI